MIDTDNPLPVIAFLGGAYHDAFQSLEILREELRLMTDRRDIDLDKRAASERRVADLTTDRDRLAAQVAAAEARTAELTRWIHDTADESFGPFPVQTDDEAMSAVGDGIFKARQDYTALFARAEKAEQRVAELSKPGPATPTVEGVATGDGKWRIEPYPAGPVAVLGRRSEPDAQVWVVDEHLSVVPSVRRRVDVPLAIVDRLRLLALAPTAEAPGGAVADVERIRVARAEVANFREDSRSLAGERDAMEDALAAARALGIEACSHGDTAALLLDSHAPDAARDILARLATIRAALGGS